MPGPGERPCIYSVFMVTNPMPTSSRRRAPRLAAADRRSRLVEAALRAAGRRSLAALTASDVAREAGVSKAAVFKYFRDRGALVAAVLEEVERFYLGLFERVQAGTEDPVRLLIDLSLAYAASLETNFDHAKIVLSWSAFVEEPAIVARLGRIFLGTMELVERTIRRGIQSGVIPGDIDVELAAWTFVGYSSTVGAAKFFGRPPEWIYHLQLALLRNLLGHQAVDRVLAGTKPTPLTSARERRARPRRRKP